MIRSIVTVPTRVLGQPAEPVGEIDEHVRALAQDLLDTMRGSTHSVGVAAPQIGIGLRICCVDVTGHPKARSSHGELVLVNPEIALAHGRLVGREGCMSVPDLTGDVPRHTQVIVQALDLDGRTRVYECDAFEARAVQHELDHLSGIVFLDRVVGPERVFPRKVYR
jgi:peptide deformylase